MQQSQILCVHLLYGSATVRVSQAGIRHATSDHNESLLNGSKCQKLLTLWSMACSWRVNLAELQNKWPTTNDQPSGTNSLSLFLILNQTVNQSYTHLETHLFLDETTQMFCISPYILWVLMLRCEGYRLQALRDIFITTQTWNMAHPSEKKFIY